jgi:hypothetical protein
MFDTTPRTINVLRTEVLRSGTRDGRPWTLYAVHATEADGTSIVADLRTFNALPLGPVAVERFELRQQDGSWTLHTKAKAARPPKSNGGTDLDSRVVTLEAQVADLTRKYNALVAAMCADEPISQLES